MAERPYKCWNLSTLDSRRPKFDGIFAVPFRRVLSFKTKLNFVGSRLFNQLPQKHLTSHSPASQHARCPCGTQPLPQYPVAWPLFSGNLQPFVWIELWNGGCANFSASINDSSLTCSCKSFRAWLQNQYAAPQHILRRIPGERSTREYPFCTFMGCPRPSTVSMYCKV